METPEQIELLKKLDSLRVRILQSSDAETVEYLIEQAIKDSQPIQPRKFMLHDGREHSDIEGKELIISQLRTRVIWLNEAQLSLEDLKFGIVTTLVQLMLVFTQGGIIRINEIADLQNRE